MEWKKDLSDMLIGQLTTKMKPMGEFTSKILEDKTSRTFITGNYGSFLHCIIKQYML